MTDTGIKDTDKPSPEELVRFLAVEGMGYRNGSVQYDGDDWWYIYRDEATGRDACWNPLTDADDMLMLVDKMREKGWYLSVFYEHSPDAIEAEFTLVGKGAINLASESNQADGINEAVCRAAYKALMAAKEKP